MSPSGERYVVPPGTLLWRVHDRHTPADDLSGVIRAAERETTTLAEYLGGNPGGTAFEMLSAVRTKTELVFLHMLLTVSAAVHSSDEVRDDMIQWLRYTHNHPDVAGLSWVSWHDYPQPAMALLGERCPEGALSVEPGSTIALGTRLGVQHANRLLAGYGIAEIPVPSDATPLVFVNYRGNDDRHVVHLLDEELSALLGESAVFRDDRSLDPGVPFASELLNVVRGCKVLVVVIGQGWDSAYDETGKRLLDRESDWVRKEIAEALRHDVWIVPLLVGARGWIAAADLPGDITALAGRQYLHLPRGYRREHVRDVAAEIIARTPGLRGHA